MLLGVAVTALVRLRSCLIIVKPEIVFEWHRQGFRWIGPGRFVAVSRAVREFRRKLVILSGP